MILPPATLGVLGGGQLGRFFVMAAHELGYRVMVLDPDPHSPAGSIADQHIVADFTQNDALERMAQQCAAITTEFENVPADSLAYLAKFAPVHPAAAAVEICQNRSREKGFLRRHGLPHAPYADILCESDITGADAALFPGILKVARFGYDGKGQTRVASRDEARLAFQRFKGEPCVLEALLPLDLELSVVLARSEAGAEGNVVAFPAAQNLHRHGILDISLVAADGEADPLAALKRRAKEMACEVAQRMDYVGTLGVEFFVVNGELSINEMAPRPHNSGHYTLDACVANQFEQQVRAMTGLPLAVSHLHSAAAMVNLLGDVWYRQTSPTARESAHEPDWSRLLAIPNLKLHLYGKQHARPGRKMGHFTVVGANLHEAQKSALAARLAIGITDD